MFSESLEFIGNDAMVPAKKVPEKNGYIFAKL